LLQIQPTTIIPSGRISRRVPPVAAPTKKSGPSLAATRELTSILSRLNSPYQFKSRQDLSAFVNWKGNAEAPIHRWLRYREAYSPNLITKLGLGDRILDPFCGCGSILIGAAERGFKSTGIDINPMAVFATKVKLTPLSRSQITAVRKFVEELGEAVKSATCWPTPQLSIADKVFEPAILRMLSKIRGLYEDRFSNDPNSRNLLHLAWISILEGVGSYYKEGNGIKYRNKKRMKSGYIRRAEGEWQLARFGKDQGKFAFDAFVEQITMMLADSRFWKKGGWRDQDVLQGSVLEMEELLNGKKFNSVVFSPPYANRFDYFESMKVELWFGGFVDSYEALGQFRKASLRSHLGADLSRPHYESKALEQLIGLMDRSASSWRMGVPELLRGYFDDMRSTLLQSKDALDSGKCYVVVGNSAFAGVIIPTDTLIAELGLQCGFKSAEILVARHLTVAPQQRSLLVNHQADMRESVVVLTR
jgi:hypothetical protein